MQTADVDATARRMADMLGQLGPIVTYHHEVGASLELDDRTFALVRGDDVYFRTDETTVGRYLAAGSVPLHLPADGGLEAVLPFHRLPEHVLADADLASAWAYEAMTRSE